MYVINDIVYAGEPAPIMKVSGIRPMDDYWLWVRFSTGEAKLFDFKPFLSMPAFAVLADKSVFDRVYIDFGVPVWENGDVDISPEIVYEQGIPADSGARA